jgi:hypothetical protein
MSSLRLDFLRFDGRDCARNPPTLTLKKVHPGAVTPRARYLADRGPPLLGPSWASRADPAGALRGTLLLAAGIPVYYWFSRRTR